MNLEPLRTCSNTAHHSCKQCTLVFETMIQANHHIIIRICDKYCKRLLEEDLPEIPTFQKLVKCVKPNNEEYNDLVEEFIGKKRHFIHVGYYGLRTAQLLTQDL